MTQLAKTDSGFTTQQIDTIRNTVARGANDMQLSLFLEFCKARNLDPFVRQVHWTPKGIITGIDGFRAIAERTGAYMPGPTRYEYDGNGGLIAAHTTVRKLVAGTWFDLEESAYWEEYAASTPVWAKLKRVMLGKCSEARALRRAFPLDLSGLYESSELDQAYDAGGAPPAPVYVEAPPAPVRAPRVVVEEQAAQVVTIAPAPVGSPTFRDAMGMIASAKDMSSLKVAAEMIVKHKDTLTDPESEVLRKAYTAARAAIGGGK